MTHGDLLESDSITTKQQISVIVFFVLLCQKYQIKLQKKENTTTFILTDFPLSNELENKITNAGTWDLFIIVYNYRMP
jgi:hypothetical protein